MRSRPRGQRLVTHYIYVRGMGLERCTKIANLKSSY